jgi:cytochrome c556
MGHFNRNQAAIIGLAMIGVSAASAGVIDDRQNIMKGFTAANRTLGGMAKGMPAYDPATAAAQLQVLSDGSEELFALFPVGSDKDTNTAKTLARPTVWSDNSGFQAMSAKFAADVKAAQMTKDAVSFTAAYTAVAADCGACHLTYRTPLPPAPLPGGAAGAGVSPPAGQ